MSPAAGPAPCTAAERSCGNLISRAWTATARERSAPITQPGLAEGLFGSTRTAWPPEWPPRVIPGYSIFLTNLVGRTGFEPVTFSVSGRRAPAAPTARDDESL